MGVKLTDRGFWEHYWRNKKNLVVEVTDKFPFLDQINQIIEKNNTKNFLEIGGFPGYYSTYIAKKHGIEVELLDYFILPEITEELEKANGLKSSIKLSEIDLFDTTKKPTERADFVFSNGLIEHFEDTQDIIQRHLNFLKPGGDLFISLPNFRGYNGLFQRIFDKPNLDKHYLPCMDLSHLEQVCKNLKLGEIDVRFCGEFTIWLEDAENKPNWKKWMRFILWAPWKILFKFIPTKGKFFSPYITIKAKKL